LQRGGAPSVCAGATPPELVLERAPAIAVDDDFQPSGLALHRGHLLTVSDRHNDAVYEIVLAEHVAPDLAPDLAPHEDVATLRPFVRLASPVGGPPPSDLEGIAADDDGVLWLASEGRSRVLRVASDGATAWVTPSLDDVGRKVGLLRFPNAGLEGIARLPNGRILLAAERDQRGLIELSPSPADSGSAAGVRVWALPGSICTPPPGRDNDFADLTVWAGQIYALERNAHVVMRIERTADAWVERGGWSYARTENDPRFAYQDRAFGVAEGLAIDDAHVYIVLDNNHDRRQLDARDRRPRLFVFRHPG
jgi:hypothetical protein